MITEEHLQSLLADTAAAIEPPSAGPAQVVAAAFAGSARRPRLGRKGLRLTPLRSMAAGVACVVVIAAALAWADVPGVGRRPGNLADSPPMAGPGADRPSGGSSVWNQSQPEARPQLQAQPQPQVQPQPHAPPQVQPHVQPQVQPQVQSQPQSQPPAQLRDPVVLSGGPQVAGGSQAAESGLAKIVKTAALELSVAKGRVDGVMASITEVATAAGGYVAQSTTRESDGTATGTLTVRVPSEAFESASAEIRRLGRVREATSAGTDVSRDYTDVQARLRTLNATRDSLLRVLGQATSIGDILSVQNNITSVQGEIEQLQGRQRVLDDQIAMASIAVSLAEPGSEPPANTPEEEPSSWQRAVGGFTGTWSSLLAHSGRALALVLIGAAMVLILAGVARWGRRLYARWAM